jgi:pimeloyl-ACP methyl ester carboxylesterase
MRRLLLAVATPLAALLAIRPVANRIARRLMDAPRTAPGEDALRPAVEALGGEVVRLLARDGTRLSGRWLPAEPGAPDDAWAPDPREAILLLHGWTGSVAPDLVAHGPFLRRTANVLGLDFRGHGGSDDGPTTFGALEVEDVAGALSWLGERGIRRVALVGSSMGGIVALAAVAALGDGRLAAADADPDAPAGVTGPPRPRIVAVVVESVTPELALLVARRLRVPLGRRLGEQAFGAVARVAGVDPRGTEPVRAIRLLEDVPLLLVGGDADAIVTPRDADRLAAAAPVGTGRLMVAGAAHGDAHAVDPAAYEAAVGGHLRSAFRGARS